MKFRVETLYEKLFCNELNIKQYKELLKCSFGDDPDQDIFCETLCDILSSLLNKSVKEVKQTNIIDIVLAVIQLKNNSQGHVIKISVTKDDKKMSMDLDLNYVIQSIIELYKPHVEKHVKENNVEVWFGFPSLQKLLEPCSDDYLYFLDNVVINDKSFNITTNTEAEKVFNSLSPKVSSMFINLYKQFVRDVQNVNFLEKYNVEETLTFIPSIEALIWFTKLLFNEPLNVFYDNMFYLAHLGHIDIKSLELLSPGEYIYMTKMLEGTLSQKSSSSSVPDNTQDISAQEFDDSGMFENES